jgi:hypothetical protein
MVISRKGQFYLIAAIIIVTVIVGVATITNYATTRQKPVRFYDLSEEINEEAYRTSGYMLVKEEDVMQDFSEKAAQYVQEDVDDFIIVSGNENNVSVTSYTKEDQGEITIKKGGQKFTVNSRKDFNPSSKSIDSSAGSGNGNIEVGIVGENYSFNLQQGQNFLFVLVKRAEQETHVSGTPTDQEEEECEYEEIIDEEIENEVYEYEMVNDGYVIFKGKIDDDVNAWIEDEEGQIEDFIINVDYPENPEDIDDYSKFRYGALCKYDDCICIADRDGNILLYSKENIKDNDNLLLEKYGQQISICDLSLECPSNNYCNTFLLNKKCVSGEYKINLYKGEKLVINTEIEEDNGINQDNGMISIEIWEYICN